MARLDWRERVVVEPEIHHGDPCIRGTRVPVSIIVGNIADGLSLDDVRAYPQLTVDDVRAALAYAAEILQREAVIPLAG